MRANIFALVAALVVFLVATQLQGAVQDQVSPWLISLMVPLLAGVTAGKVGVARGWLLGLAAQALVLLAQLVMANFISTKDIVNVGVGALATNPLQVALGLAMAIVGGILGERLRRFGASS